MTLSGSLVALLSAACFAGSIICTRRGVVLVKDASLGVYVSVLLGVPLLLLVGGATGEISRIDSFAWVGYVWLAAAGVAHFVAGRSFHYIAVGHLGANMSNLFSGVNLLWTVLIGFLLLRESFTLNIGLGVLLILLGPTLLAWPPQGKNTSVAQGASRPRLSRKGVGAALASSLFYGVSPLFVKLGLQQGDSPLAGTLISYIAASLLLGITLSNRERRRQVLSIERQGLTWFALAGLFVTVAQLLRYIALGLSPLSVAGPLISTSPLFALLLSFLINRRLELFGVNILAGALMVAGGAALIYQ